jgi:hypothetical protein
VRGAFLLTTYQLQEPPFVTGDTYEEWKKETRLDICTGSRTEDNGAQESAHAKIAKKLKRSEGATRQKAFSIGLSLDSRA